MTFLKLSAAAAALVLACTAPAQATDMVFTGSVTGSSTGGFDSSCAPALFRTSISPDTTVGTSSLGSFTYSSNVCQGGAPITGIFTIDFANGAISGTQFGSATPTSVSRLFNLDIDYTILSGTGDFLGATGAFTGTGTADSRTAPTQISLLFNGIISTSAVPEPATWLMMLFGFGAIGAAARRSGRRVLQPVL